MSGEWGAGKREWGVGIVIRNPEVDKFHQKYKFFLWHNLKKSNFNKKLGPISVSSEEPIVGT